MNREKIFKITPSGVDYALKCKRCLWLAYKGIKLDAFFPPIFNAFDLIQKKILINKSVKTMSNDLPDGRIMTELSGFIGSTILKDNNGRSFIISGKTDVVVEFNTKPKKWSINDWPDLTKMEVFKEQQLTNEEKYCTENNISIYTQTK